MRQMLRNRLVLLVIGGLFAVISFSCSSNRGLEKPSGDRLAALDTMSLKSSIEMSRKAIVQQSKLQSLYRDGLDSILTDDDAVDRLMGIARDRYSNALRLQVVGNQDSSAIEFEKAINVLNDLSYYPGIESDSDFVDLSQRIIGDYEKYISTIQNLGPGTSVFALQEKLSQIVDSINVNGTKFPKPEHLATVKVPLVMNRYVEQNLKFFTTRGRWHMQEWIYRSGIYIPMMKKIFMADSLPPEIAYLSMPESGLNPDARSWARAVGLWQFIRSTGALYGLRSNWWYDERRNPVLATEAAASHLKDLYNYYKNWYLAIAAYNCGTGSVNRAIWRSGGYRDFWKIERYLPRETRNYVPQYIAVTMIALNPKEYGFADSLAPAPPPCDTVRIPESVDLRVLADAAGMDYDSLMAMNPELVHGVTPPQYGENGYPLLVPQGMGPVFAADYQKLPASERLTWAFHTVRYGETLWTISHDYGVSLTSLRMANHLSWRRSRIYPGMRLIIPVNSSYYQREAQIRFGRLASARRSNSGVHIVRRGETLSGIAAAYGISVARLERLNHLSSSFIKPRMRLLVAAVTPDPPSQSASVIQVVKRKNATGTGSRYHVVKRGETLSGIAAAYGMSVAKLKRLNHLRDSFIRPRMRLLVAAVTADPPSHKTPAAISMVKPSNPTGTRSQYHVVRSGETLSSIAFRYGITVADLKDWNNLGGSRIQAGVRLRVSSPYLAGNKGTGNMLAETTDSKTIYRVRRGDSLWSIARKFGVSMNQLREWNGTAPDIHPGQRLVIYN